jgi:hypothetical protein
MKIFHFGGLSLFILSLVVLQIPAQAIPINVGVVFGIDGSNRNECNYECRRHRHHHRNRNNSPDYNRESNERVRVIYVDTNASNTKYNQGCYAVDQNNNRYQINCNSINSNNNNTINRNNSIFNTGGNSYPVNNSSGNRDPNCPPNDWCDRNRQ